MKKTLDYGTWPSAITTNLMVSSNIGLAEARLFDGWLYWLEFRPQQAGRNVILRQAVSADGPFEPQPPQELLTGDFNCRSQVHEYGGACYLPTSQGVFFVNQANQQIYRLSSDTKQIVKLTDAANLRFADLAFCADRQLLLAIAEDHGATPEPANSLVAVSLINGQLRTLHSGRDFYASATFSADGSKLAWLSWDHPNMPWDGTSLWLSNINEENQLDRPEIVAGGASESVFQPQWNPTGELYYVSDRTNWWNIYRHNATGGVAICPLEAEFGRPQWQFGMTSYGFVDEHKIVTSYHDKGATVLALIDVSDGSLEVLPRQHSSYDSLRCERGQICYIAQSPVRFAALYVCSQSPQKESLVVSSSSIKLHKDHYSTGLSITFPTAGGQHAHGYFYAPAHPDVMAPSDQKPPLIVMIHGGPTSATADDLSLKIQFWTSRGFAVLDVNYRGSTGFGRKYRDALKDQWGVADVEDCDYGVRYLVERGLIDAQRVAIRGGSAGGYTTLAALALTDTFKAGASLYGVSDLTALATDTHKFESRYLDSLIGPYPQEKALYEQRSPINHADKIKCPVIFLQGLEDKIVPPNQAQMMIDALRKNDVKVAYLPFEGEQHGFRQAPNIMRAFEAELWFYGQIFGFSPADKIAPVAFVGEAEHG